MTSGEGELRHVSRVEHGGCTWHESEPYQARMAELEAERNPATPDDEDPWEFVAIEYVAELIEKLQGSGVGEGTYDAPVGDRDAVAMSPKPWLGEFKVPGVPRSTERGRREYRLYFGEPGSERDVLGALLGHKTATEMGSKVGPTNAPRSSAKQTSHIVAAMGIVKRWCRAQNVDFRTLP